MTDFFGVCSRFDRSNSGSFGLCSNRVEIELPCRARWRNVAHMEGLSQETLAVIGAALALAGRMKPAPSGNAD